MFDYIKRLNAFLELSLGTLTPNEVVVYMRLFQLNNTYHRREWFGVGNSQLATFCQMTERITITARNGLKQKGFINFIPGKKGQLTQYQLLPVENTLKNMQCICNESVTNTKPLCNESVTKVGDLIKDKDKVKDKDIPPTPQGVDGDGEVISFWDNNIHPVTPFEAEQLHSLIDDYSSEWVLDALRVATENNARNIKYVKKVLENRRNGVSPHQQKSNPVKEPERIVYAGTPEWYAQEAKRKKELEEYDREYKIRKEREDRELEQCGRRKIPAFLRLTPEERTERDKAYAKARGLLQGPIRDNLQGNAESGGQTYSH